MTERVSDDFTLLVTTLKSTELLGAVSLLYGTLLHSDVTGNKSRSSNMLPPSPPPEHVLKLATATLSFINAVALLDTTVTQVDANSY